MHSVSNIRFVAGSLHFANVIAEDEKPGKFYGCTLYNHVFRGFVQGDDQIVRPSVETGTAVGGCVLLTAAVMLLPSLAVVTRHRFAATEPRFSPAFSKFLLICKFVFLQMMYNA